MIAAHGARVVVTDSTVEVHPDDLEAALRGSSDPVVIPRESITGAEVHAGDAWDESTVVIAHGETTTLRFAPGDTDGPEQVCALINGEDVATDGIEGFTFTAIDVETAEQYWGSVTRLNTVRVVDGEIEGKETVEASISDMLRALENPVVAHNAYFHASALRYAALDAGEPLPDVSFACTLTLSDERTLFLSAEESAEIMLGIARREKHSGSVMELVHALGYTMGTIDEARVTPVLQDFSGEQSSLQKAQEKPKQASRGPAPWQSVATPDTIPEPAVDADPDSPLYAQHVTLTGEFEPFDKGQLWDGIARLGGQVGKNVTKKTTILVTGEWATMTSKEKRARELMDKGQEIEIWPADKLLGILGLDEQPPF